MPQIIPYLAALALTVVLTCILTLTGCGDTNQQATFAPESGHPDGWSAGHAAPAKENSEPCFGCHGENLDGGIAKVSCFTSCHMGSAEAVHPAQWGNYAYARHAAYVASHKTAADPDGGGTCATAVCHGVTRDGVPGSGPSCSVCHLGGPLLKHPADWYPVNGTYNQKLHGQYTDLHGMGSCRSQVCHGADLQGVFLSGPACSVCHR
jgi:hypothetical protein